MLMVGAVVPVVVVMPFVVLVVAGWPDVNCTEPNWPVWLAAIVLPSPGMNKLTPSWVMRGTVHFGELHFQQNFLRPNRTEGQHIDHVLGVGLGDHAGALGNVLGRNVAGKHNGGTRRGRR